MLLYSILVVIKLENIFEPNFIYTQLKFVVKIDVVVNTQEQILSVTTSEILRNIPFNILIV